MINLKTYNHWLAESSGNIFKPKRGKPVKFDHRKYPELAGEFFDLISIAYQEIGGHSKIKKPEDIFSDPDWNWWEGVDIHGSEDFDIIFFGQKTRWGVKFSGVGHDGSKEAKREYIENRAKDLKKLGYYIEVSAKLSQILISKYGCPQVTDQKTVELLLNRPVKWMGKNEQDSQMEGDGWYVRNIGGHPHDKIMLGKPKV